MLKIETSTERLGLSFLIVSSSHEKLATTGSRNATVHKVYIPLPKPPLHLPSPSRIKMTHLLAVPHTGDLSVPHLLLQLENAKHERLGSWRAARDVDIDRDDPVAAPGDGVAVVVVAAAIGTAAHGNDPSRVGHLVVDLAERRRHLVGECAGHNHHVGLTWRRTENDAHAVLVVARRGQMHHLESAARETESHGPERALAGPVGDGVQGCERVLHNTV